MTPTREARPPRRSDYTDSQLRIVLARLDVTGRELARRMKLSANWVSMRVTGNQPISHDDAVLISEALGVSLTELAGAPQQVGTRRYARVVNDFQAALDDPEMSEAAKRFLLRGARGLLDMVYDESAEGVREEPQMRHGRA